MIHSFSINDVEAQRTFSVHELGIAAAVKHLPAESRPQIMIVGVEPAVIDYGMELSPVVQAALPEVARTALRLTSKLMENVQPTTGV